MFAKETINKTNIHYGIYDEHSGDVFFELIYEKNNPLRGL